MPRIFIFIKIFQSIIVLSNLNLLDEEEWASVELEAEPRGPPMVVFNVSGY